MKLRNASVFLGRKRPISQILRYRRTVQPAKTEKNRNIDHHFERPLSQMINNMTNPNELNTCITPSQSFEDNELMFLQSAPENKRPRRFLHGFASHVFELSHRSPLPLLPYLNDDVVSLESEDDKRIMLKMKLFDSVKQGGLYIEFTERWEQRIDPIYAKEVPVANRGSTITRKRRSIHNSTPDNYFAKAA